MTRQTRTTLCHPTSSHRHSRRQAAPGADEHAKHEDAMIQLVRILHLRPKARPGRARAVLARDCHGQFWIMLTSCTSSGREFLRFAIVLDSSGVTCGKLTCESWRLYRRHTTTRTRSRPSGVGNCSSSQPECFWHACNKEDRKARRFYRPACGGGSKGIDWHSYETHRHAPAAAHHPTERHAKKRKPDSNKHALRCAWRSQELVRCRRHWSF